MKNNDSWEEIKASLYVGDRSVDDEIDWVIDRLKAEYNLPVKKKKHADSVISFEWFAWHPVKTPDGWVWWKNVLKIYNERPVVYQCLLPIISYKKI